MVTRRISVSLRENCARVAVFKHVTAGGNHCDVKCGYNRKQLKIKKTKLRHTGAVTCSLETEAQDTCHEESRETC